MRYTARRRYEEPQYHIGSDIFLKGTGGTMHRNQGWYQSTLRVSGLQGTMRKRGSSR
jgi:hypothetical protein